MTKGEYKTAQEEVERIEKAIAEGHDTPKLDERLNHLHFIMDDSSWIIDPDTGDVVDKEEYCAVSN